MSKLVKLLYATPISQLYDGFCVSDMSSLKRRRVTPNFMMIIRVKDSRAERRHGTRASFSKRGGVCGAGRRPELSTSAAREIMREFLVRLPIKWRTQMEWVNLAARVGGRLYVYGMGFVCNNAGQRHKIGKARWKKNVSQSEWVCVLLTPSPLPAILINKTWSVVIVIPQLRFKLRRSHKQNRAANLSPLTL